MAYDRDTSLKNADIEWKKKYLNREYKKAKNRGYATTEDVFYEEYDFEEDKEKDKD